jgi:hypothetical protein
MKNVKNVLIDNMFNYCFPDIAGPDLHRGRHHLSNPGRHSPLSGRDPEARGPNDRQHVRRHAQSGPHYGSRQSLRKTGICSHNLG